MVAIITAVELWIQILDGENVIHIPLATKSHDIYSDYTIAYCLKLFNKKYGRGEEGYFNLSSDSRTYI